MKYIICQDWANTSGNHAGMLYLGNKLQEMYPKEIKTFCIEDYRYYHRSSNNIINFLRMRKAHYLYQNRKKAIQNEMIKYLKSGDEVILMEYLELFYPMHDFAYWIKEKFPQVKLSVIVHLVPEKLDKSFSQKLFEFWMKPVDRIITFGRSLTEYLVNRGIERKRIHTSFHYVDDYYILNSIAEKPNNDRVKVLAMGNQMRNIELLKEVVEDNPETDFIICQGVMDMSKKFKDTQNVQLIPFVSEQVLREYMLTSDVSLNIMKDTIGSNVIVTSLGMGLGMICSDVGSIRDYCSESNTLFCKNNSTDFSNAIRKVSKNRSYLKAMKESAINNAIRFKIKNFKNNIF